MIDKTYTCPTSLKNNKVKQDLFIFKRSPSILYKKNWPPASVHLKGSKSSKSAQLMSLISKSLVDHEHALKWATY
jgi:hypothetical protein